jgi:methionyl-tRNA synthetase
MRIDASSATGGARTLLVGSSVPNPNGDIHLGHLAGPFLSGDIFARFRRMLSETVYYLSGTDDYQSWTQSMAERLDASPAATAEKYSRAIEESCRLAGIEVTHFHHPSRSPRSTEIAREMVSKMHGKGELIAREVAAPYCESCARSLFDVFVRGRCPCCGEISCGRDARPVAARSTALISGSRSAAVVGSSPWRGGRPSFSCRSAVNGRGSRSITRTS